jgi:alpha-tubulin suppressor-like RCC1 family protein
MKKYIWALMACLLLLLVLGASIPAATPARADAAPIKLGFAWGKNSYGQLGNGTNTDSYVPVQVSDLTGVTAIATGKRFTLAARSDGSAWAWGYNGAGQLGNGATNDSNLPLQVKDAAGTGYLTDIIAVSGGIYHSLALKSDGTVWAWGGDESGQLGVVTTTNSNLPNQVNGAAGTGYLTDVVAIAAGSYHSLALKSDGTVWAWGNNGYGQLGFVTSTSNRNLPGQVQDAAGTGYLTDVIAIAAGSYHSLALKSDGTVWAWGDDNYGQLGDGNSWTSSNLPIQVKDKTGTGYLTGMTGISAGENHSLALESNGTVWAWGDNYYGQLGDGSNTESYLPVQVKDAAGTGYLTGITNVAAGRYCSLAVDTDGRVWAWGRNAYTDPGTGSPSDTVTPVQVSGVNGVIAISAAYDHSAAISVLSSDATLHSLTPSAGTLNPAFATGTLTYTTSVDYSVASMTVMPVVNESHATLTVNGLPAPSGQPSQALNLDVGDNTITVMVTAQDGTTTRTYTVTVTRQPAASSDDTLSNLTLSSGTLNPVFAPGITGYTASVDNSVANITVTPTVNESHATVTVNGQAVTSGQASPAINLNVGANIITIVVTAQDGTTTLTYTVTVTRQPVVTVIPLVVYENITVSDAPALLTGISLVVNETITVSDSPVMVPGLSLVVNETITVSDAPVLTPSAQITYTLTIAVSGQGSTDPVVGPHTYTAGTVVSISATPALGWRFVNWTGDVANPNSASTNVTMNAAKTVTANFDAVVIHATLHSPGELRVYDSQNRVTGLVNGVVKEEIPNSSYNSASATVVINPATDSYYYQVAGTGVGAYGLEVVYSIGGQTTTFTATDIPILSGAIHQYTIDWDALSQGQPGVTVQVDLNGDGVFEISFNSDGTLTHDEYISQMDTTPPVTTVSLNPGPNANGWNNTNVTANLTATDIGSGVKEIHYILNGGAETIFTGASTSFLVSIEGSDNITYFAKDNAGNTETPKSVTVKIDKTKPTININSPQAKEYLALENFTLNFAATDTLSGISSSIQATLNGGAVTNGQLISLSNMEGSYTVTVQAKDKADNSVSKSVTFTVKSAKALKRGTIDKLNSAKTGDKKADGTIDQAIRLINNSLEEKLWVDPSHLVYGPTADWLHGLVDRFDKDKKTVDDEDIDDDNRIGRQSPPGAKNGITVFHQEMAAIMLLDTNRGIDREKNERDNKNKTQPSFDGVISDLVNADMILAKVAITDAKNKTVDNPAMSKIVSREIESAEKEFSQAMEEASKGRTSTAITRFSHAWLHSQLAMHFASLDEGVSQTDKVPPVTTASLNPDPNANGWNNTNVTANLKATDSGSGVKEIHYTLNGGAETVVPGASASFLVSIEGSNNATYFARDNAGNTASLKYMTVKIDKTKPEININSPQAKEYLGSENITLSFSTSDNLSGIAGVTATLDTNSVNNGQVINLSKWDGGHTLTVTTIDKAGNAVTKQVTFTVKSEGARAVKNDAVTKLKNAKTGDKKTDETIDRAIQFINDSLEQKLWVDPSHLVYGPTSDWLHGLIDRFDKDKKTVDDEDIDDDSRIGRQSPPGARNGITVFHQEMAAIILLDTNRGIDRDKNEKDNRNKSQPAFEDVISDLVNADMMLAKVAITDAKNKLVVNPAMNKIVSKEIESAEKEYTLAVDAANKGQSAIAVTRFSHAWLHAQLAMQFATMEVPQPPPKIEPKDNGDRDKDKDNKKK